MDVAIVGGGFTGLWTAHYLSRSDPHLRVAVIERAVCGFGASGRNGGWCSALFAASPGRIAKEHGAAAALAMHRAMVTSVREVGTESARLGIDCHFARGGTISAARSAVQLERAGHEVQEARTLGIGEEDVRLLDAHETKQMLNVPGVLGGVFSPHCAAIHPARLARGLAEAVERAGVKIYERTPVAAIHPGRVVTSHGTLRAEVVIRATEGYTAALDGFERAVVPIYSLMIATEPLGDSFWADARLDGRPTFADMRHMVIYGQRTADDRIAFGGRGAPYHFGSSIKPDFDAERSVHRAIRSTLVELFPALRDIEITHAWGGPLGVPRDWHPSVGLDRGTGIGWAGGYVGDGVSTTNLAGRTLADLVLGRDTELVTLAWVGHRSPDWEREPLRWIGINGALRLTELADRAESRTGRRSVLGKAVDRLTGS